VCKLIKILPHLEHKVTVDNYKGTENGKEILFIIPNKMDVPDLKNVLCLSDTSLYVWDKLKQDYTVESIVTEMAELYNVDISVVARDVSCFIQELLSKDYISILED
jgi:hypothetical protein